MKTRYTYLLPGLFSLFVSTAALAHGSGYGGSGYGGAYGGNGLSGGISLWADSYGHSGFTGNLGYGAVHVYPPVPYYGHAHSPRCGHGPRNGYVRTHDHGYRQGRRHGYGNGYGNDHWNGRGRRNRH